MSRVDEAYEAVRAHLHERPYRDNPEQVYADLGALSQLLTAVTELTRGMSTAAKAAADSDDGDLDDHVADVDMLLFQARGNLGLSRRLVDEAHIAAGHLVFPAGVES